MGVKIDDMHRNECNKKKTKKKWIPIRYRMIKREREKEMFKTYAMAH